MGKDDWTAIGEEVETGMCDNLLHILQREMPKTAANFPHVIENIKAHWAKPSQCRKCFENLLTDRRGGRQGFPLATIMEISNINEIYETNYIPQKPRDSWTMHEHML
ncbi:MAG: hypothetical protein B7Y41_12475 [Hydrogenophilales bacterium 28-61-23]|nr:MAG: hypothetical protein B7Y41_12475 [Hydrogenophilales bacterium 28-61-23]